MSEVYLQKLKSEAAFLQSELGSLVFYKELLDEPLFEAYLEFLRAFAAFDEKACVRAYAAFNRELLDASEECSWAFWLAGKILTASHPLSRQGECDALWDEAYRSELGLLGRILRRDGTFWAEILRRTFPERNFPLYDRGSRPLKFPSAGLCRDFHEMRKQLLAWEEPELEELEAFHRKNGYGLAAKYKAMLQSPEGLSGIERLDPIMPDELFDYSGNLDKLQSNTEALIAGQDASHVLLYGTRGCGKSSAVKAMLNRYEAEGLRLIEINPRHLAGLADVMKRIESSSLSFILFIDDLSFRSTDTAYTELKSFLQGGAMDIPSNCRLYVTSNRRHLVLEQLDEAEKEIYGNDGLDERISLSDRFGLKLHFLKPLQSEYLEVVRFLAEKNGLEPDDPNLEKEALAFAQRQGHRSPREAKLFIRKYLSAENRDQASEFL